jgi:predicted acyltransferase
MVENQRYLALDVFRGMTVCFMIIVNTPGDWSHVYGPLLHAPWHGFTPTDLVFPSFLFAVGNAMAFSMRKFEGLGNDVFWKKTIKRTLIIFLIGFLSYWFPFVDFETMSLKPLSETRILGVLQRIAICFFVASIVIHFGSKKFAFWFSVAVLLLYWLILYLFGDANDPFSLAGYAGNALDFSLLGEKHLYHGEGVAFDPEGILSTLPSIVNVIAGYLVGDFIRTKGNSYETIAKLMLAGCVLIFIALTWNMAFPINKKIWTSSFVLLTVGLDMFILPLLIYVIEMRRKKQQRWTYFFVVFGRNPLFIYILSEILIMVLYMIPVGQGNLQRWIYRDLFSSFASAINASLLFALFYMMLNWLVGYFLDRKKIYIRV